jgi:serralysin
MSLMALADNGKPTYSTSEAVGQLTRDHVSWNSFGAGSATTITYSFRATEPTTMPNETSGFSTFSAQQILAAELALQSWADVANIQLNRLGVGMSGPDTYSDAATIRFANYSSGADDAAAFSYLPSTFPNRSASSSQGDSWYNSSLGYNANPQMFAYGQRVLVHEVGHTLGLAHPGDYDAGEGTDPITYSGNAAYYEDSRQYTVMSYFSETNTGGLFKGYYPSSPMLHDIAAIQSLYGRNMSAFLGDTVYGFGSNSGRPWFTASSGSSPVIFAVWDAGGSDTLNFSGYGQNQRIDLNAGRFSDVGGMAANVSIADGAVIENADGGSGGDTIVGNGVGNYVRGLDGSDSIDGGAGDDDLNGNVGTDTVTGGDGADWVRGGQGADIVVGAGGNDPHVNGNLGDDTVYGATGNDTVYGGQGNDRLFGDEGDDWLSGDLGADVLTGGAGADRFLFRVGAGGDWITDFSSAQGDRVMLAPGTAYTITSVSGQAVVDLGGGALLGFTNVAPSALGDWLVFG